MPTSNLQLPSPVASSSLSLAWTEDYEAIDKVVNSREVAPYVLETDTAFHSLASDSIKYLGVYKDSALVGVYLFIKRLEKTWEVHTCLTLACRGKAAFKIAKVALQEFFATVDAECLTTFIPVEYEHVKFYARASGLVYCGTIPNAFKHADKYLAIDFYAVTKEAALCLQQQ